MKTLDSPASPVAESPATPSLVAPGSRYPYRTLILGAGRLGTALALQMQQQQLPLLGIWNRRTPANQEPTLPYHLGEFPTELCQQADLLLLAVSDDSIAPLAQTLLHQHILHPGQIVLHCSGRLESHRLDFLTTSGCSVGRIHPLQPIAIANTTTLLFANIAVGVEGSPPALAAATSLAHLLGGYTFSLEGVNTALYHTAAVFASNYLVCLAHVAQQLLQQAGLQIPTLPLLLPLMEHALRNLQTQGLPHALTGPISRADISAIQQHTQAIQELAPQYLSLYVALAEATVPIAQQQSPTDAHRTDTLQKILQILKY